MSDARLSYAVITPARDEATTLPRLAASLARQSVAPRAWVIVENGSTDDTQRVAQALATSHSWIHVLMRDQSDPAERGAPIVRALHAALETLEPTDVVVNVDADVSFPDEDYFERLLGAFTADPFLGIASGSAHEHDGREWRQRHVTGSTVWGASRAYRRSCLEDVLPLEERLAWDGIDELRARVRGWRTATLADLPFHHHRREGERDGAPSAGWISRGKAARYMGYRLPYLALRALHHARREPAALALVWGYAAAAVRREETTSDAESRRLLRGQQRVRNLARRRREALGR